MWSRASFTPGLIRSSRFAFAAGFFALAASSPANSAVTPMGSPVTAIANAASFNSPPQIATSVAGSYVVAAACNSNAGAAVCAQNFYSSGTASGSPYYLVNNVSGSVIFNVAMNSSGVVAVAWSEISANGAAGPSVHFQRFNSSGTPSGSKVDLPATTAKYGAYVKALGIDAGGNLAIAWTTVTGSTSFKKEILNVSVYSYNNTLSGSASGLVKSFSFQNSKYYFGQKLGGVSLSMNDAGNFVVTWSKWKVTTGAGHIYAQRFSAYSPNILTGSSITAASFTSATPDKVSVVLNGGGAFAATWLASASSGSGAVTVQKFDLNGNANGAAQSVATYCNASSNASSDIAMDASGNFTVVWSGAVASGTCTDSGIHHIYVQRYDYNGQALGSSFMDDNGSQSLDRDFPRAIILYSGLYLDVIWNQTDQSTVSVLSQMYSTM